MSGRNDKNEDISDDEMDIDGAEDANESDEEGGLRINENIYIPPPPTKINIGDHDGPRLMITKIVNINFKSYGGEVVIGPFHECFSAIVGPNGSGKSNVIDSMLFVFGYRASKIRSKKISVLIHNSSELPNLNSCSVAVHFQKVIDHDNGYKVVPNSNFIISRTAFKDNSSFYELNGKKVQFKEIAKLLRAEGVDLDHNRFLILQGEVEQIAMMKPKAQNEHDVGMLEFLEDIIGTARYKLPLQQLMDQVDILSERLMERMNRLRIVEKERESLHEPMQEAVDYLKMENTIAKLQNKLYYCKKSETTNLLKNSEENHKELENDYDKLKEEMKNIHNEKNILNKELKDKCQKWSAIQQKKDAANEKFDQVRKKDEALHAELVEVNKRRKSNINSVKNEQSKLEDLGKVPQKNNETIEEYQALIRKNATAIEKEETALEKLINSLKGQTEPLIEKRTELETKLIAHRTNVDKAQATFDLAESELHLYTSTEKKEHEKLVELQESVRTAVEKLKDRKTELSSYETKIPATQTSLAKAQKKLNEITSREADYNGRLRKMRVQYEEDRAAMQATKSKNNVINSLMEEKIAGRLPGVFGRLGDLGAVDAKYDVAVSTACGPLDNVVVDTVETAQACIQFLRDNDIGRCTFIPLEKQQRFLPNCRQKIETPENVPRLFDLIKVQDERVLPAFYYGLQNTLVADNLDQASRIAYGAKRYRVVTLKGELIETSGTMSGGGRTVLRGRIGQRVKVNEISAVDLEKLQKNLDEIFAECQRLKQEKLPLEDQIQTLTTALNEMTVNKDRFKIEVDMLQKNTPLLKQNLKEQEKKANNSIADPGQVKKLTVALDTAKKQLEKVREESQSTEDEVKRINNQIDELSGNRIKEQQNKISKITKSTDKAKSEICRLEVAIKTAERDTQKAQHRIEMLENDVKTCQQRIKDIQDEKKDIEDEAKNILSEIESYAEALTERDEAGAALKEQLDSLQAKETKMKSLKIDLDQKLSDSKKIVIELTQKIEDFTKRIKALKLNQIPEQPLEQLPELTDDEISGLDIRTVAANLAAAKERLPEEVPNMQIIKDFLAKDEIFLRRSREVEEVTELRNKMRGSYDMAKRRRTEEFFLGFSEITSKLKEMYQMITLGGAAELELVDSLDPFTEGIVFSVRPPKKSWKNISNLSGGEKTLSSLALVFALHHFKPTPLYFMDEIDAALDFKNVSIVGTYIKERTKNAQFIVISLRSEMFELADTLVGIYKTHNLTKCATINIPELYRAHPNVAKIDQELKERLRSGMRTSSQLPSTEDVQSRPLMPLAGTVQINESRESINNVNQTLFNNGVQLEKSFATSSESTKRSSSKISTPDAKRPKK
ncbi:hypothetical protein PV328_005704 [Microctonus aethiopoides]|uniref:Structural maintenance of chromosomes protein n=1 Tax=Microctonus aethiopoides TaxID=144406 RepID=A0AA39FMI3_9HYME|nr:hypothetical protein PV328_005704 [Microctonus aethiopoides]